MADRTLEVSDPRRLRALAHPLRMELLRLLREHQPATGAELAELTGESTASVSYHLATLARHGFVEPDPRPGPTRKHKPWRTTYSSLRIVGDGGSLPPAQSPEGIVLGQLLVRARAEQDAYVDGSAELADEWRDQATFQLSELSLTADQLDDLSRRLERLIDGYRREGEPAPGTARFSVSFVAVPVGRRPAPARSGS